MGLELRYPCGAKYFNLAVIASLTGNLVNIKAFPPDTPSSWACRIGIMKIVYTAHIKTNSRSLLFLFNPLIAYVINI